MSSIWHSRRLRLFLGFSLFGLVLLSLFRLSFFVWFQQYEQALETEEVIRAFYIGAKFDWRLLLIVMTPVLVLMLIPKVGVGGRWPWVNHVAFAYLWLAMTVLSLFYVLDFGHYAYLNERVNSNVLRFIDDLQISSVMLWQSYPVIWISLGIFILALSLFYIVRWMFAHTVSLAPRQTLWKWRTLAGSLLLVVYVMGLYGQLAWFPLRWSNALFSQNKLVTATALNPALYLSRTFKNRHQEYRIEEVREAVDSVQEFVQLEQTPDPQTLDFSRVQRFEEAPLRPNIVIVLMESLAAHWLGSYGNPLQATPNMDRLIDNSVWLRHHYVPNYGTARSIWGLFTGIPDVTTVRTASRNPMITQQHSLMQALEGYQNLYLLGGNANWANIRGFLQQSIPDLEIYEEGDFDEYEHVDVWGVSDLSLFDKAVKVLDQRDKSRPFMAYIQTAANHSPYTIPEDSKGFEVTDIDAKSVHEAGFLSVPQYQAVRLLDHSVGYFMQQIEQKDYFDNTIFLFFGDHGVSTPYSNNMGPDRALDLVELHSAVWYYAPGLGLEAQKIEGMTTLMDLLPTLFGMIRQPYVNATMGLDVMRSNLDDRKIMLVRPGVRGIARVGLLSEEEYLLMDADQLNPSLYKIGDASQWQKDVAAENSDYVGRLTRKLYDLYVTAHYMLNQNPPIPH